MRHLLVISVLLLSGCATTPTPVGEAKLVPQERVYFKSAPSIPSAARAIFIRDQGFLGGGVYQHLFINGERAASIDVGETLELLLNPGEYIFGVQPTDPFGTHALYSIDQQLQGGRLYYYRILIDGNSFQSRIQRFSPEGEKP